MAEGFEAQGRAPRGGVRRAALGAAVALGLVASFASTSFAGSGCGVAAGLYRAAKPLIALARARAESRPVRVLAIGSSSTEGIGASAPDKSYPASLERDLRERWSDGGVSVVNAGIGGETAPQTVARIETLVSADRPDLVVWQVGTNDAVRGGDEAAFRLVVERGIAAATSSGADLLLLDQQFYPAIKEPVRYERYVSTLAEVAAERRVGLVSRYALMKAWGERSRDELTASLASDGFHMSDRGYACLAQVLAETIEGAVRAVPPSLVAGVRGAPVIAAARAGR